MWKIQEGCVTLIQKDSAKRMDVENTDTRPNTQLTKTWTENKFENVENNSSHHKISPNTTRN